MYEVVLIQCLDEWIDFSCPLPVGLIPGGVRDHSLFLTFFRIPCWVDFGSRPGPQNPVKIEFLRKRARPGAVERRFSGHVVVLSIFSPILDRFLQRPTPENYAPATAGARFSKDRRFRKNTENGASGDQCWDPKRAQIDVGGPQNRRFRPTNFFWEGTVFYAFSGLVFS